MLQTPNSRGISSLGVQVHADAWLKIRIKPLDEVKLVPQAMDDSEIDDINHVTHQIKILHVFWFVEQLSIFESSPTERMSKLFTYRVRLIRFIFEIELHAADIWHRSWIIFGSFGTENIGLNIFPSDIEGTNALIRCLRHSRELTSAVIYFHWLAVPSGNAVSFHNSLDGELESAIFSCFQWNCYFIYKCVKCSRGTSFNTCSIFDFQFLRNISAKQWLHFSILSCYFSHSWLLIGTILQ